MWLRRRNPTDQTEVHQDCRIKVEIKGKNGVVCVNRDATHSLDPTGCGGIRHGISIREEGG
jgi:hypothetical protein